MESSQYLMIFATLTLHNIISSKCACLYKLSKSYSRNQPIYFIKNAKKSYIFATPKLIGDDRMIEIQNSETLVVTCPYGHETHARHYKEEFFISCKNEIASIIPSEDQPETVNPDHYKCKNKVGFTFRKSKNKKAIKQCESAGGRLYNVGVYINFKSKGFTQKFGRMFTYEQQAKFNFDWRTIYISCYRTSTMNPVYTMYTMDGNSLSHRQNRIVHWNIDKVDIPYLGDQVYFTKIRRVYDQRSVWEGSLSKIPNFDPDEYFDLERKNLVPGLLVPENDMPFLAWKHVTYLPLNIAAMWQQVVCSWKNIERVVKLAGLKLQTELEIYTGIQRVLELLDLSGRNTFIRILDNLSTGVAAHFWKLVYYKDKKQAIVFVLCNNPYKIYKDPDPAQLCPKKRCSDYGWPVDNDILPLGQVYCCTVPELLESINELKNFKTYLDIEGVFQRP